MTALVVAEHDHRDIRLSTRSTITAAQRLSQEVVVLIAGWGCQSVAEKLCKINRVSKVLMVDHACYQHPLAENLAPLIAHCVDASVTHVLAPATTFGKNVMPRVAALLNVAQVSDIIEILDERTYCRPIYAGNALATIRSEDPIQVITVRMTAFEPAIDGDQAAALIPMEFICDSPSTSWVSEVSHSCGRPELSSALRVIAGGRGLQNAENFTRLMTIADRLHAAVGATRAAVDAGMAPNEYQVGQTGQVVAPALYIAVGISGAIQHLAGMKDSKIIVAINKDPQAPIFQIADYGLVGDITDILSEWEMALDEMHY
ncbi:MAG: electron transfer flavoprotein subunit beta [Coxiella sp. RIFCSPHIGHO2_12_FULL_44_14]|nr:MAG: electron transfer flavoprotein subunit beta [Coxiella sp. RIFCSPHIGHO2_12_FULL_44_14]